MKLLTGFRLLPLPLAFAALTVTAQQEPLLEEILVTASKRGAQKLQDIPISVQALSGDKLIQMGATDFNDFFRLISGLNVFDQGPGDKRYIVRGVNATGAGTVGLYLDEVIVTGENAQDGGGRQPDIKLFDLDRVEVLKGPQGTTFGSSSLSGTIRYITNKPDLANPEFNVRATLREPDRGSLGSQIEAAASFPLVEDKLALRVSGLYLNDDGYIDNRFGDGVNSDETDAARAILLYTPTSDLSISLMAMYQDMQSEGPAYFNDVDYAEMSLPDYFQADLSSNPFKDKMRLYNATIDYGTDYGDITATLSRYERDTEFNRDASAVVGPYSVITQPKDRELDSYEIRFASDWDSRFQVLFGVFHQNEDRFFRSQIFPSDPDTGKFTRVKGFSLDRNVASEIEETAVFSELSYDFTDSLTLTAGARWFDIDIAEVATAVQDFGGNPGAGRGPVQGFDESDVIGKLNLSYHLDDDIMVFAQWSQGFRAGGTNDQTAAEIADVDIPSGYGSDSLDNYEIGLKSTLLDGRMIANASLYYIDWADIQIQDQAQDADDPAIMFPFRANGGGADIYGLEVDLNAQVTDRLEVGLVASYTDAELSRDNPIPGTGIKGDAIPYIPDSTVTLTGQYRFPFQGSSVEGLVGLDVSYMGGRNTELRPDNPLDLELDSYTLVNVRAGVEGDSWTATLAVDNVFDEDTVIDVFRIIPGLTPDGFIPLRPRTISLTLSKRFF